MRMHATAVMMRPNFYNRSSNSSLLSGKRAVGVGARHRRVGATWPTASDLSNLV